MKKVTKETGKKIFKIYLKSGINKTEERFKFDGDLRYK